MNTSSELSLNRDDIEEVIFPTTSQKRLAWFDIKNGLLSWRIWFLLAYQDIKVRYNRSVLGPFWLTLSMAITVYSMGYLYSHLFHMKLTEYFPYLVAGMLGWSLISTNVIDMVEAFTTNDSMMKQVKLPYTLYVHRIAARNVIIFLHNILVYVPIAILYHSSINLGPHLFLLIPGLFIIYFNSITFGLIFAMVGARYRDISQLIKSLIQVIFFLTPVMWDPKILPQKIQSLITLNPAYSLLECIRAPLLGYSLTSMNLIMVIFISLSSLIISYYMFASRRARIIYWL